MKIQEIKIQEGTFRVGDLVVYNHIISFCNEFNGKILGFRARKNGGYRVTIQDSNLPNEKIVCNDYCLIRHGNNGSGVDWYYN